MNKHVLITGGAGFIGSHLARELLNHGYEVRALDNLSPQVHGPDAERPGYLHEDVELQIGDIRDPRAIRKALDGIDAVYHLAAAVGVGQSMYRIRHYMDVNNIGTSVLLEALIEKPIERVVVASSMSIYGEGLYRDEDGNTVSAAERSREQLEEGEWEIRDDRGRILRPSPTPESKTPSLASIYALSKYDQERMSLVVGRAYGLPTVAMRFFNVYGAHQALSNPYTGVLAIFASRLLNGNAPLINEDGLQRRDFVSVRDVAVALRLALETPQAAHRVFNVGSGNAYTVREVADRMADAMGREDLKPVITGKSRAGDIRHCFADISLAKQVLDFQPRVTFDEGLAELARWLDGQIAHDRVDEARTELAVRGLAV